MDKGSKPTDVLVEAFNHLHVSGLPFHYSIARMRLSEKMTEKVLAEVYRIWFRTHHEVEAKIPFEALILLQEDNEIYTAQEQALQKNYFQELRSNFEIMVGRGMFVGEKPIDNEPQHLNIMAETKARISLLHHTLAISNSWDQVRQPWPQ